LFGSNAVIDLDADVQEVPQGQATHPSGSESVSTSAASGSGASMKRRASTSKVWKDFDGIYEVINGKKYRTCDKCRHCKKDFQGKSTHGTVHLIRRILICSVLQGCFAMAQS
jgi:hypothetical protein